jgi:pimeloyl-ACP methyl ester carboxylesterase
VQDRLHSVSSLALLLPVLLAGCSEDASNDAPSSHDAGGGLSFPGEFLEQQVAWKACVLDDAKDHGSAECADVRVPLFWERPAEGSITLHLKRHGGSGAPQRQLWMLDGGPGGAGTTSYGRYLELLAGQDPELEILTLDHRGTGLSNRLGCPEQEKGTSPWGIFLSDEEWTDCLADLASRKVPLEAYTVTQAAWDTAFLVQLLQRQGAPRFVWGSSYGTYLAHRYAQIFPSQPTGVILDSICPSESCHLNRQDELANQVVHDILDLCGQDSFCSSKLGSDPWQYAVDVLGKMRTGHCPGFTSMGLGAREIQQMPFILAQRWGLRPLVPAIYYRMNRCEAGDVAFLKKLVMSYMVSDISEDAPIFYRRFSHVVSRHITFSELMSESLPTQQQADALDASLLATSHNSAKLLGAMASWPRYQPDAWYHGWASSGVPFLMLNGTLDLQTPMAMADEARVKLTGAGRVFVEIPWGAHGAIGQTPVTSKDKMPCGMQLVLSQVRAPGQEPDTSCLQELLPVDFTGYGDRFGVETALGTSELWENAASPASFHPPSPGKYVFLPEGVPMHGGMP